MYTYSILVAAAAFLAGSVLGQDVGESGCPCISLEQTSLKNSDLYDVAGDCLKYKGADGDTYCFPLSYGLDECKTHDADLEPFCNKIGFPGNPDWCVQKWCWVDQGNCNLDNYDSSFFPGLGLRYSYQTCGGANTFINWIGDGVSRSFSDLVALIERYVVGVKQSVENSIDEIREFAKSEANVRQECNPPNACNCGTACEFENCWDTGINFDGVNLVLSEQRQSELNRNNVNFAKCVTTELSSQYLQISGKEYNNEDRIAFQYYGDQSTGGLTQWPEAEFCSDTYDARFRPWYASAASGPKDIVIVLDTSGSMGDVRMKLAIEALKAVVRTLTWADYVSVVTFNNAVDKITSRKLVQATEEVVKELMQFADKLSSGGGTDFDTPLAAAYDILKDSRNSNDRKSCAQAILFMTDGESSFDTDAFDTLVQDQPNVVIFSYALGSGAAAEPLQAMACKTNGIFTPVPNAVTLPEQMAGYYKYYVKLQPTCKLSWIKYADAVTGTTLVAGCAPIFDYADVNTEEPEFVGVTCQDLNTIVSLEQLASCESGGFDQFVDQVLKEAQSCPAATPAGSNGKISDKCILRRLRASVDDSSLCQTDLPDSCSVPPQPTNQSSCEALDPSRFEFIKLDGCDDDERQTCSSSPFSGGAVAAVVVGIIALISVVVYCFKSSTKPSSSKGGSKQQREQRQEQQDDEVNIPVAQMVGA